MNNGTMLKGHLLALVTTIIWGTTLISSKILLTELHPLQIVVFRFIIGYAVLFILHPKIKRPASVKEELLFLASGVSGVTCYMFLQNLALVHTTASNVGLILGTIPLFTAGLFHIFVREEKITSDYLIGFAVAITGIFFVITGGRLSLAVYPLGDFLAIATALCWAVYSVTLKKILTLGLNPAYMNRRIFFYGLLTMLPLSAVMKVPLGLTPLKSPVMLGNILYLGALSSALCFLMWSRASDIIGGVKTVAYVYLTPFVTIAVSAAVLHETVTLPMAAGCLLILGGLYISDRKSFKKPSV